MSFLKDKHLWFFVTFGVIILVFTTDFLLTIEFTNISILLISSGEIGFMWLKSNLNLSEPTKDPF